MTTTYCHTHSVEADVSAAAIWALYEDVTSWPEWDAEAELITRDGPFETGTTGTMTLRGQEPLSYRLAKVEPLREFIDETPVGDIVVRVCHRLEEIAPGRLRITYKAQLEGPEEQTCAIGPGITGDFPETMASLVSCAQQRST